MVYYFYSNLGKYQNANFPKKCDFTFYVTWHWTTRCRRSGRTYAFFSCSNSCGKLPLFMKWTSRCIEEFLKLVIDCLVVLVPKYMMMWTSLWQVNSRANKSADWQVGRGWAEMPSGEQQPQRQQNHPGWSQWRQREGRAQFTSLHASLPPQGRSHCHTHTHTHLIYTHTPHVHTACIRSMYSQ